MLLNLDLQEPGAITLEQVLQHQRDAINRQNRAAEERRQHQREAVMWQNTLDEEQRRELVEKRRARDREAMSKDAPCFGTRYNTLCSSGIRAPPMCCNRACGVCCATYPYGCKVSSHRALRRD